MLAMLWIVRAGVIADAQVLVIDPVYLRIVEPTWALVPEDDCVPTAPGAL